MTLQEIRQQYPQYEDMSDAQLARALHSRFYSDMDFGEFSQRVGLQAAEPPSRTELALDTVSRMPGLGFLSPEVRQAGAEVGRQVGLTGRHLVEGAAAIPAMVAQPIADVADMGLEAAGSDFRFGNQRQGVSRLLDRANLPRPQNPLERVVGDASQALASGGSVVRSAQAVDRMSRNALPYLRDAVAQAPNPLGGLATIQGARSQAPNAIANMLTQAPGVQAAGEILAGGTIGTAREMGANPLAQMLLGTAAGFAAPASFMGGNSVRRGIGAVADTLSAEGQRNIAAQVLQDRATNPRLAADNLANAGEIVPGSIPTSGPASRDMGLLAFERGLRSRRADDFGIRASQQNAARQRALDEIAGTEADIAAARLAREEGTASAREAAFEGNPQVDTAPILARADEILAGSTGARREVRRAIQEFRDAIAGETDAARLYGIRQDMGAAMGGRLAGDRSDFKLASRELIQLQRALDEAIEGVAPGFRAYLGEYARLSKPIDQMESLQGLQDGSSYAVPDAVAGREILTQARFNRNLNNLLRDRDRARSLTDEQIATARAVAADLDAAEAINSANIRPRGSDTYQNLSSANVISRVRGGTATVGERSLMRSMDWLFKHSDAVIEDILTEAMLDPAVAERLLREPTPENIRAIGIGFAETMRRLGYGSALGATTASGQTEPQ